MQLIKLETSDSPRLDAFLLTRFPTLSQGLLHRYLRENKIKVNGKKLPLNTRLAHADEVKLFIPDDMLFAVRRPPLCVIYEDEHVLLADKPAGLPVAEEQNPQADTLLRRAQQYAGSNGPFPALCHRLDTGTSGLVLLAKTPAAHAELLAMVQARLVEKTYLCVTFGHPQPPQATLRGYLHKDAEKSLVKIVSQPEKDAKTVVTAYRTLALNGPLALLEVTLITGRTHQIRAHLSSIGCPILGDSKYGNNAANRSYRLKYQALCAYRLHFPAIPQDSACAALSEHTFYVQKPWYCQQMINNTLKPHP